MIEKTQNFPLLYSLRICVELIAQLHFKPRQIFSSDYSHQAVYFQFNSYLPNIRQDTTSRIEIKRYTTIHWICGTHDASRLKTEQKGLSKISLVTTIQTVFNANGIQIPITDSPFFCIAN